MFYSVDLLKITKYFYWGLDLRQIKCTFPKKNALLHFINIEQDNRNCNV